MSLEIARFSLADSAALDAFVAAHPDGTPFHGSRWSALVEAAMGIGNQTLLARRDGAVTGVLPLGLVRAALGGRRLVSAAYGVYGGALAEDPATAAALDQAAREVAKTLRVRSLEFRYLARPASADLVGVDLYQTYRKALPETVDAVLGAIPRKARAEVRKSRDRFGMTLIEDKDLLDDYYRLYCMNKRGLGSPLFRRSYFKTLLDIFGKDALLHAVRHEGRTVGAVISLVQGGAIYPYYSGALPEAGRLGVNNAMYGFLMEDAVARGFRLFDFGRSRAGSGPADFKRNMGFEATPLTYQFYLPQGGEPPSLNPSNPKTAIPRKILASLPMWMAQAVGPTLMRHVP
jgi:FemAB-related protein (PEP-CTERM system-associated)